MSREIKKYDILMLLPLTALSLADPITDIVVTLMKFYSEGHMRWFVVGLIFFILPCFPFAAISAGAGERSTKRNVFLCVCLGGFHPFSTALLRLEALIVCSRKKLWHGEAIEEGSHEFEVLEASRNSAILEAVFEAAPQFVIQLYVAIVQQEPVSIIQVISLSFSFLSLVWTLKPEYEGEMINVPVKYKILNFPVHLLLLSVRLFVITCFVVAFKWFIILPLIIHAIVVLCIHSLRPYTGGCDLRWWCGLFVVFGLSWIGYDTFDSDTDGISNLKTITACSQLFITLQNFIMIVTVESFDPWYGLSPILWVVGFSCLGHVIRNVGYFQDWAPMGQAQSTINRLVKGVKWWLKISGLRLE